MKICVLIKQVPDKDSKIVIGSDSKSIDKSNITNIINESDNYALEEALLLKEKHGGEVTVCSLGGETSNEIIKTALAKGADKGIHLIDKDNGYKDVLTVAKIIAKKLEASKYDLILSGLQSDDSGNCQLGLLIAELLGTSHSSLVMSTEMMGDDTIKIKQELESGWFQWTDLSLPASLTIQSGINNPRYASLRGIMMAKNKPLESIDINISDYETQLQLEKLYIPSKTKETQYIEGSTDEMASEIFNILTNEIKVL
tara:strand:+ start:861 stop:1628 length:768 start_codon:yes stop_codon:yes gene_type:complete